MALRIHMERVSYDCNVIYFFHRGVVRMSNPFYSDCCGEPVYGLNTNTCSECGSDCKALSWEEYVEEIDPSRSNE
jgi:hypothetical protein